MVSRKCFNSLGGKKLFFFKKIGKNSANARCKLYCLAIWIFSRHAIVGVICG